MGDSERLGKTFQCSSSQITTLGQNDEMKNINKKKRAYDKNPRLHCKMFGNVNCRSDFEKIKIENIKLKAENMRLSMRLRNSNEASCVAMKLYEKTKNKRNQLRKKLIHKKKNHSFMANRAIFEQHLHSKDSNEIIYSMTNELEILKNSYKQTNAQLESTNSLLDEISQTVCTLEIENRQIKNELNLEISSHKETKKLQYDWISKFDHSLKNLKDNMNAFLIMSENLVNEKDDLKVRLEITENVTQRLRKMITCSHVNENEKSDSHQPYNCERLLMECEGELTVAKHKLLYKQECYDNLKLQMSEKEDKMDSTVSIVEEEAKKLYTSLEEKCLEIEENKQEILKYKAKNFHLMREKMEIQCNINTSIERIDTQPSLANTMQYKSSQAAILWVAIDQMHLCCLKTSKSSAVAQYQKMIEDKVYQYLSLVPHDQRFCSEQVWEILLLSAHVIPEFSPVQAAKAFKLIEKFAANLVNLKIKSHSRTEIRRNFIDRNLYGAQKLFMQMCYQFMSTGENVLVLDTPVHKDCIISIARDCRIAQTECRIINQIFKNVEDHEKCTWKDILNCRVRYIGTPEQLSIKLIKHKKRHSV